MNNNDTFNKIILNSTHFIYIIGILKIYEAPKLNIAPTNYLFNMENSMFCITLKIITFALCIVIE